MYTKENMNKFEEAYIKIYPHRINDNLFEKMEEDEYCYKLWAIHELFCFFLAGYK
jgi:hypothetical protein